MNREALLALFLILAAPACSDDDAGGPDRPDAGAAGDAGQTPDAAADAAKDGSADAGADGATDGGTDAGEPELGQVTVLGEDCAEGAGDLPGTTCLTVQVECPGIDPLGASVRNTPGEGAPRGTVVFGSGGPGTGFYETTVTAGRMLGDLAQAGFRIVQRAWEGDNGWTTGPGGVGALSCRYATLLTWVHDELHSEGAFCASGNSAGSGEIAYALTRWGRGAILDLAVPTGGPPFAYLDYGCARDADWTAECLALVPEEMSCEGNVCTYGGGGLDQIDGAYVPETPCRDPGPGDAERLRADSVLAEGAVLDYPDTLVHFVFGMLDCSAALTHGLAYASAITSRTTITLAEDTLHSVFQSEQGAEAIRTAIEDGCL